MRLRAVPLLVIALLPLVMGFSKKPTFTISFHAEADEMDMKKSMFPMQIEGRQMLFKIVPEFSQQNVVAFHPFDSETGDKGVALQLDFRGRGALEMVTRTRRGQFLLAMVNGKPVDYVVLDQVIDNGLITIWRGITDETIKGMDKKYPRIKPGGPPTVREGLDMQPATKKERKRAYEEAKEAEKAAEKARKAGKPEKPEIPSLDAPRAPVSNSIPVEGAPANPIVPPKATPADEPPLPLPRP
jgi:hypothetical protein